VTIEHQEGLDTDRVLIINHGRVFIGDVEENGYFNAYGINGSVWGNQTSAGQVIWFKSRLEISNEQKRRYFEVEDINRLFTFGCILG
jgi:hypothetical protein